MMPASIEASMAAAPSEGPTRRSEIAVSSSGSAPPSISAARSLDSVEVKLPVMSVEPPLMPTSQPTSALTSGEEMTSPSRTIAMRRLGSPDGLHAALPVMSAQVSAALAVEVDRHDPLDALVALDGARAGDLLALDDRGADLDACRPGRTGRTWLSFLAGLGVGLGGADDLVDRQLGGLADPLLGLLGLLVVGDAGQLDEDPVLALAGQRGLGDAEGVDAAAEHLEGLVDVLGLAGVCSVPSASKTNCAPPREVEAQVGLDVDRERRAPGQEAEDEDEADPDTT